MTHEPPTGWDASAHPGFERLAELDEGLLDSADADRVSAHAANCAHCQAQQAQLAHASTLLRSLPDERIPPDVAARLEAALADADPPEPTTKQPSTVVPMGGGRRRWRAHPTAAGLGAAAAVAALVAALVVGHNSGGSSGGNSPGTSAASGAGATHSVLDNLTSTTSGTDYTANNLATKVPELLAVPQGAATAGAAAGARPKTGASLKNKPMSATATAIPPELTRLHDSPGALRSCVLGVEAGGAIQRPLAIDFAHYQGAPAVLIVLPGLNAGNLDAWFVGPACSEADANLLGYKAIPSSASPSPGG